VVEEYVEKRVLLTVKNILIANFKLLTGWACLEKMDTNLGSFAFV